MDLTTKVGRLYDFLAVSRSHEVILTAGMMRSGSTWVYNLTRLSLLDAGRQVNSGWIDDQLPLRRHTEPTLLIKLHDYEMVLARVADRIIYSYRDVRDVVASMERMWGWAPSIEVVRDLLENDRRWRRAATFRVRYEDMMDDQVSVATALRAHLGLAAGGTEACLDQVGRLSPPPRLPGTPILTWNPVTLLHPGHMTDGRFGSWRGALDPGLVSAIDQEFGWWLKENGYPAGDTATSENA